MSQRSVLRFRRENKFQICGVPGCTTHRHNTSRYCRSHERRKSNYGDPLGSRVDSKEIAFYREQFSEFLTAHTATPQVQTALGVMDTLIQSGHPTAPLKSGVNIRLQHLCDEGVTAREALEAVGGIWLLSKREPAMLPDKGNRLTHYLGLVLFKLRPAMKRLSFSNGKPKTSYLPPGSQARFAVGDYVRRNLGVFFIRVIEALDAQEARLRERAEIMMSPFNVE